MCIEQEESILIGCLIVRKQIKLFFFEIRQHKTPNCGYAYQRRFYCCQIGSLDGLMLSGETSPESEGAAWEPIGAQKRPAEGGPESQLQ